MPNLLLAIALASSLPAAAHDVRPAYLEIRQSDATRYRMHWKQPARDGGRLAIDPTLAPACDTLEDSGYSVGGGIASRTWVLDCGSDGLDGRRIVIRGLDRTMTDVLVELRVLDRAPTSRILRPDQPGFDIASPMRIALPAYLRLGLEHLLLGLDHVLFVVALALLVPAAWPLVKACTAFTAAHSITLALAALGVVGLPQAPVEVAIALSLLLLAGELARPSTTAPTAIRRRPWLLAFAFGLLHGFGFAGALSAIGLPQDARVPALLLFNLGVELGQLMIIGAIMAMRRLVAPVVERHKLLPTYALGGVAAFWVLDRLIRLGQ